MGLELNYSNESKLNHSKENLWQKFNQNTLREFCLVNDFGSVTAFRIKYEYLATFKPTEAEKILELFSVFHKNAEPETHEKLCFVIEKLKEKINCNQNSDVKTKNKVNLNFFKSQLNKKHKFEIIQQKKAQTDMCL